jgi:predicted dehydrogenase
VYNLGTLPGGLRPPLANLFREFTVPTNGSLNRKLRMGLIGGGQGAFIGRVHATAAVLDNRAALVAGALSSDPKKAKDSASDYDIPAERAYGSYKEMAEAEGKRADRVDFVSVATPNHTHFEIAKTFAEAGFNVICDKPLTSTSRKRKSC